MGRRAHGGKDEGVRVGAAELVAEIEFVEWTPEGHLRHARFVGLRDGMEAREVGRHG